MSRLDRLYVPFLLVFAGSCLIALSQGTLTPRGVLSGLVIGSLPYSGPGNYFITYAFQFAAVFPVFYWAYRRTPGAVVAGSFALAAAWELSAPHIGWVDAHASVYSGLLVRFLPFIALGAALADRMLNGRGMPRWWWLGGAAGALYLAAITIDSEVITIAQTGWRALGQTFLVAFYTAVLVAAGLRWLPRTANGRTWQLLGTLGVASYEIFLVQIVWFTAASGQRLAMLVPNVVACCLIGYGLHLTLRRVPKLAERFATQPGRGEPRPARGL